MKKSLFGIVATVMFTFAGFANNSVEKNKKLISTDKKAKTEKFAQCSVQVNSGNTLTLNCGTCTAGECLTRLKAILDNQKPHVSTEIGDLGGEN